MAKMDRREVAAMKIKRRRLSTDYCAARSGSDEAARSASLGVVGKREREENERESLRSAFLFFFFCCVCVAACVCLYVCVCVRICF